MLSPKQLLYPVEVALHRQYWKWSPWTAASYNIGNSTKQNDRRKLWWPADWSGSIEDSLHHWDRSICRNHHDKVVYRIAVPGLVGCVRLVGRCMGWLVSVATCYHYLIPLQTPLTAVWVLAMRRHVRDCHSLNHLALVWARNKPCYALWLCYCIINCSRLAVIVLIRVHCRLQWQGSDRAGFWTVWGLH